MSLTKVSYSMITGAPYNVLDYGADPTGVADSTAAFQAAIGAYGDNRDIYVPAGTYLVKESLFMGIRKKLFGDSSSTVLIRFDPPVAGDTDCIVGDAFTQVEGLSIIKLAAFACQGLVSYTPTTANGWRNGLVRDVVVADFDVAIGSTQGLTQGLMFQNVYERVRTYNATTALQMGAGSNANTFLHCEFWNSGTAVQLNNVTTQTFIGCGFENSTNYDFIVEASYNIEFETCYFEPARGGTFDNSTGTFDNCHSTAFVNDPNLQFITYSNNSVISVNDFTDYNFGGASSYATQWYARSGDGTGYAEKSNLLVRTGTEKADGIKVAAPYISNSGTVTLANGATQTIVALAGAKSGRYDVYATIRASGDTALYASIATVIWDTTGARIVASNGTNTPLSLSGTNVIVTNSTGGSFAFDYGYLRIGPL
jgi:hypothetical protein